MVLHAEARGVEQLDALGGAVVEVHMREADAAEALVLHHRRDAALDPETQVAIGRMLGNAAGKLGHEGSQAGEHQAEAVVLRGDLHAARDQVHNRLVAAAMAEL